MSIKIENLTKYYGDYPAVKDISFEVKTGEIVGFLGPNGAGKTTTLNSSNATLNLPVSKPAFNLDFFSDIHR